MVAKGLQQLLAEANAAIDTVSVGQALAMAGDPDVVFVDVRETIERQMGTIRGSVHAPRGHLEAMADPATGAHLPVLSSGKHLVLFCGSGNRSALAAKTLADMGVSRVSNMAGGFSAWTQAGGPLA